MRERPTAALLDAWRPLAEYVASLEQRIAELEQQREPVEWQTIEEYADAHRIRPGAARQRAYRGQIPGAVKDGARWLVPRDARVGALIHRGERRVNGPAPGTGGISSHAQ